LIDAEVFGWNCSIFSHDALQISPPRQFQQEKENKNLKKIRLETWRRGLLGNIRVVRSNPPRVKGVVGL
jgi:hypothetical protein